MKALAWVEMFVIVALLGAVLIPVLSEAFPVGAHVDGDYQPPRPLKEDDTGAMLDATSDHWGVLCLHHRWDFQTYGPLPLKTKTIYCAEF